MNIRKANTSDIEGIRHVYLEAFSDEENELVAKLACDLLEASTTPETVSLVAEEENNILGHIAFSPVFSKQSGDLIAYILAPLAVSPSHQKQGTGKKLIEEGFKEVTQRKAGTVLVYGDPAYYLQFGFKPELAEKYLPPYKLAYPSGWQAVDLQASNDNRATNNIECVSPLNKQELW